MQSLTAKERKELKIVMEQSDKIVLLVQMVKRLDEDQITSQEIQDTAEGIILSTIREVEAE